MCGVFNVCGSVILREMNIRTGRFTSNSWNSFAGFSLATHLFFQNISPVVLTDPNVLDGHLSLKSRVIEAIEFEAISSQDSRKNQVEATKTLSTTNCESTNISRNS